MTTKINPPSFNSAKSYERYKQELLAWREITELSKNKQGIAVALSLPEDDENKIKDKVFDQIALDELKDEDGLNILIAFLDKHLGKDDLADIIEKFEDFDDFKRKEGQTIQEFIAMFDCKYRKIEKKDMSLPSEILAFKLLKKANITKEEKLLVLTGMNFDNKAYLYEEAQSSLKKFEGDSIHARDNENVSIKLEPAYLAENEDILLTAGYVKNNTFYDRRQREGQWGYEKGTSVSPRNINFKNSGRKINPLGNDGRTLTFKACGSFRHMLPECPDSWENMQKLNIRDGNMVFETKYN